MGQVIPFPGVYQPDDGTDRARRLWQRLGEAKTKAEFSALSSDVAAASKAGLIPLRTSLEIGFRAELQVGRINWEERTGQRWQHDLRCITERMIGALNEVASNPSSKER